jgi:hypothetical protein
LYHFDFNTGIDPKAKYSGSFIRVNPDDPSDSIQG